MREGLIKCMDEYWSKKGFKKLNSENYYFLKQVGTHYAIDMINITGDKEEFKRIVNERICLLEANDNKIIPNKHLYVVLNNLPENLKKDPVPMYIRLTKSVTEKDELKDFYPGPFSLTEERSYTSVKGLLNTILKVIVTLNGDKINDKFNDGSTMMQFNGAGIIIKKYLENKYIETK